MDRPLRVLVCSGNLGNALPDQESIAAWIPADGCYSEVVDNQEFPLPSPQERDALLKQVGMPPLKVAPNDKNANGSSPNNGYDNNDDDDDHFDIIVLGMQEATFEIKEEEMTKAKTFPLWNKANKEIRKTTKKGFATVTTLTGSTDHTSNKKHATNILPEWLKAKDSSLIHALFQERCPSYDFAIRFQRGEMRLEVLVRKDLEAQVLSVRAQNTGLINLGANKGGIVGTLLLRMIVVCRAIVNAVVLRVIAGMHLTLYIYIYIYIHAPPSSPFSLP